MKSQGKSGKVFSGKAYEPCIGHRLFFRNANELCWHYLFKKRFSCQKYCFLNKRGPRLSTAPKEGATLNGPFKDI